MKRRFLSIVTALALGLSLSPSWALAAEIEDGDAYAGDGDAVYEAGEDAQAEASQEARASAADISIMPGFVFAQGVSIVIKENEDAGITSIYDTDENLLSGETDVSDCAVYGGWYDYDVHYSDTSILMKSGMVSALFGGNYAAGLTGNTKIEIRGGWVGFLCGAGNQAVNNGNTSVLVDGGEVNTLYGGSFWGVINGNTDVTVKKGSVSYLYGGDNGGTIHGNTSVTLDGGSVGWAFGGGYEAWVDGTATVTVNEGAKVVGDPNSPVKGNVTGGGIGGTVKNARVIYNGGDVGFIYGGGEYPVYEDGSTGFGCDCTNVSIEIMGALDEESDGMIVYGGGFDTTVETVTIKFYGTACNSRGQAMSIYGSGYDDRVENVKFIIGRDSTPSSVVFYAKNEIGGGTSVGNVEYEIENAVRGSEAVPKIAGVDGSGAEGTVSVHFKGEGDVGREYHVEMNEVDEVTVEQCRVSLSSGTLDILELDRLEIDGGTAQFTNLKEVSIGELVSQNGTICLACTDKNARPGPVSVGELSADSSVVVTLTGGALTEEEWQELVLFDGPAIDALEEETSFFVSGEAEYILTKTEAGIQLEKPETDTRKQAYLQNARYDKSSYQYGDTIVVTAELADVDGPIAGEWIDVLVTNDAREQLLARVMTDENGTASAAVPVGETFWGGEYTHLAVQYLGSTEYKGNTYAVSLKKEDGAAGGVYMEINPADVVLTGGIAEPVFTAAPSTNFETSPEAFYTAEVVWTPAHAAFQPEVEYTAGIRLIPKQGYSVNPDRISSITWQGRNLDVPDAAEIDGSLLLASAARFTVPAVPVTGVTLEPDALTLAAGDTFRLISTVLPDDAQSWHGDWVSSNPAVAEVSSQGTVTAVGAGTAIITVIVGAASGEYTAECTVTVHGWQTEWSSDENSHWHACADESCAEVKDRAEHIWDEGSVTTPPTAAANGEKTYTCTVCGRTRRETVPSSVPVNPSASSGGGSSGGGSYAGTYAVTIAKPEHGKITSSKTSASGGSTVTLTVTPDTGYVLDTLTVTDSRGNEVKLTAQGGGRYTFTMPGRAVTVKVAFAPLPAGAGRPCDGGAGCPSRGFTDLGTVGTWYHEAVDYVLRNGLMGGYGDGTFGPSDNLTRAQFAQILYNREGRPAVTGSSIFADVASDQWCAPAVNWAAANGIVSGYGSGLFGPDGNITREQLAVMLWRYAGSPAATDRELRFTDADRAGGYALDALRWAAENGILHGYGDGRLNPVGLASRAQAAQILRNYFEK